MNAGLGAATAAFGAAALATAGRLAATFLVDRLAVVLLAVVLLAVAFLAVVFLAVLRLAVLFLALPPDRRADAFLGAAFFADFFFFAGIPETLLVASSPLARWDFRVTRHE
jgi:hypothetical protein